MSKISKVTTRSSIKQQQQSAGFTLPNKSVRRANLEQGAVANVNVATKTSAYTLNNNDDLILADASGGAFTLTLPTAVGAAGKKYIIKKIDSTVANAVTLAAPGSETIDGSSAVVLYAQNEAVTVVSDGTNWQIVERVARKIETVYIQDQKPDSVDGGAFTAGAWRTRDLNTLINPLSFSWVSLFSNEFTLDAGTYLIRATVPAYRVESHKARLWDVTSSTTALWGSPGLAEDAANATQSASFIEGYLTVTAPTTYRIEHRCVTTNSSNGFGDGNGSALGGGTLEIFTQVEIARVR